MYRRMNRAFASLAAASILLSAILLSGCAASGDYPSLARRPIEGSISANPAICAANSDILALADGEPGRISGSAEPAPALTIPPPVMTPSRDLATRLEQLVDQARAGHARFGERRSEAERTVSAASGAATGSESWSVASIAVSGLESARSDVLVALGELDQRYAEASTAANVNTPDLDAISATRDQVNVLVEQEDEVLNRLRGRLR